MAIGIEGPLVAGRIPARFATTSIDFSTARDMRARFVIPIDASASSGRALWRSDTEQVRYRALTQRDDVAQFPLAQAFGVIAGLAYEVALQDRPSATAVPLLQRPGPDRSRVVQRMALTVQSWFVGNYVSVG